MNTKIKRSIELTLKLIISVLIALEIAIPPNPYKTELILGLSLMIVLKYDIVERIEDIISRVWNYIVWSGKNI
jgi:hypothetical protein|tara:strand:+ start:292 stop:510 length:219 start_codon:yes stop_codon:yes gene_type:complete